MWKYLTCTLAGHNKVLPSNFQRFESLTAQVAYVDLLILVATANWERL
jgi:hypothetical protein